MNRNQRIIFSCFIGVLICLSIAGVEGWVTAVNTGTWYYSLNKPFFSPPAFLFAPVWTVLYIMIGIAGGLAWNQRKKHRALFMCFLLQQGFNFLWPCLFFGQQAIGWALIDIIFLWITLLLTLIYCRLHYKIIFYWLTPYFLWVSFATMLNFSFWVLN